MARKKKGIPKVNSNDILEAFGGKEDTPGFAEELEANLASKDLGKILAEKRGGHRPPPSRHAILAEYPPPDDDLDLHGLTGPEAEIKTLNFIRTSNTLKQRTIRIITGKGLHSDGPAILPDIIETQLKELKAAGLIFDFQWEKKEKHKSGAVIVYLK